MLKASIMRSLYICSFDDAENTLSYYQGWRDAFQLYANADVLNLHKIQVNWDLLKTVLAYREYDLICFGYSINQSRNYLKKMIGILMQWSKAKKVFFMQIK